MLCAALARQLTYLFVQQIALPKPAGSVLAETSSCVLSAPSLGTKHVTFSCCFCAHPSEPLVPFFFLSSCSVQSNKKAESKRQGLCRGFGIRTVQGHWGVMASDSALETPAVDLLG